MPSLPQGLNKLRYGFKPSKNTSSSLRIVLAFRKAALRTRERLGSEAQGNIKRAPMLGLFQDDEELQLWGRS